MTEPVHDEMISAYLDGELTGEEQVDVERRLAQSPESRQLLEELRALSGALKAMPGQKLDEGFRDQVLRRAERAMLTEPARQSETPSDAPADKRSVTLPIGRSWRSLAWASLTVAVALMLMIYGRNQDAGDRRVAKQMPVPHARLPDDASLSAPSSEPVAASEVADDLEVPAEVPARQAPAGVARVGRRADSRYAAEDAPDLEEAQTATERGGRLGLGGRIKLGGRLEMKEGTAAKAIDRNGLGVERALADDRMLIVRLDLSAEAAKSGAFDELLKRNNIAWEEEKGELEEAEIEKFAGAVPSDADSLTVGQPAVIVTDEIRKPAVKPSSTEMQPAVTDAVLVEASYRQVEQVLQDAQAQPTKFLTVVVEPAPADAAQRPLTRYARSRVVGAIESSEAPAFEAKNRLREGVSGLGRKGNFSSDKRAVAKVEMRGDTKQKKDATTGSLPPQPATSARAQRVKLPAKLSQPTSGASAVRLGKGLAPQLPRASGGKALAKRRSTGQRPAHRAAQAGEVFDEAIATKEQAASQPLRVLFLLRVVDHNDSADTSVKALSEAASPPAEAKPETDAEDKPKP